MSLIGLTHTKAATLLRNSEKSYTNCLQVSGIATYTMSLIGLTHTKAATLLRNSEKSVTLTVSRLQCYCYIH